MHLGRSFWAIAMSQQTAAVMMNTLNNTDMFNDLSQYRLMQMVLHRDLSIQMEEVAPEKWKGN